MSNAELVLNLNEALRGIEDARSLVGRKIPDAAKRWAERHGLEVHETEFAPAGQIFIVGAVPVPTGDLRV